MDYLNISLILPKEFNDIEKDDIYLTTYLNENECFYSKENKYLDSLKLKVFIPDILKTQNTTDLKFSYKITSPLLYV